MPEEEKFETEREYLEKVDFSSIVWQQIHLLNKISSMGGRTSEYNDTVLSTCYLMRSFKRSKYKETFLGRIKELDDDYWKKTKEEEMTEKEKGDLLNKTAREKHKAIMDFIAESGLSGSAGGTITAGRWSK